MNYNAYIVNTYLRRNEVIPSYSKDNLEKLIDASERVKKEWDVLVEALREELSVVVSARSLQKPSI